MTDPIERPPVDLYKVPPEHIRGDHPTVPIETQMAVQQLCDAGFSEDQQAALTTALLRVLALWTQQATRGDLQTELHAGEQRLAQQLDALREELHREVTQHAKALREDMRGEFRQQADLIYTTRVEPARRRDLLLWLITALLGLTCAGVLLLVVHRFLGL
jgi:hypothetical protein